MKKSYIAVHENDYFEGEEYVPECGRIMGICGFKKLFCKP